MKTVYDVLIEEVQFQIKQHTDVLTKGAAKDYPEYREQVGVIRGLRAVEDYVNTLKQRQEQDDDE